MNGKQSKRLRRMAENETVGQSYRETRRRYLELKINHTQKWRKEWFVKTLFKEK